VFSVTDPDVNKGDSISATGMLDRSATRLESEFGDEPELKADLKNTLGGLYLSLGEYARAKELFEQSLALQRQHGGDDIPTFADSLVDLASANIALDLYAVAETELHQALDTLGREYGDDSPHVSKAMRLLGECYTTLGRSKEAEPLLRKALAIDQQAGSNVEASDDLAALAAYDFRIHRFKESVELYRQALVIYREKLGDANSKSVLTQSDLADAIFFAGDIGPALAMSRESAGASKKLFGQDHPLSLRLQRKLVMLLAANSFYDEAEPLLADLLTRTRATMGPRHSDVAEALLAYVEYDFGRGRYEDALAAAQEANSIWRKALGEKNERLEEGLKDVAACEQALGQFDNAILDLNSALELSRALAGNETITYADLEQTLGKVYIQKGDASAAEPYCSDAERIAHQLAGIEDPLTAEAQFCLAAETSRKDDRAAAVERWKQALETARHAYADAPLQQERFTYPLAKALTIAGQQGAALAVVNDDLQMRRAQFGEGSVGYANVQALRGVILARLGRKSEAAHDLNQAIDSCKSHPNVTLRDCLPKLPLFYEDCKAAVDGGDCVPQ
jgi:tetratricopeptide (TPR) repeat protein